MVDVHLHKLVCTCNIFTGNLRLGTTAKHTAGLCFHSSICVEDLSFYQCVTRDVQNHFSGYGAEGVQIFRGKKRVMVAIKCCGITINHIFMCPIELL